MTPIDEAALKAERAHVDTEAVTEGGGTDYRVIVRIGKLKLHGLWTSNETRCEQEAATVRALLHRSQDHIADAGEKVDPSAQGPAELFLQLHGDCQEHELTEPVDYTNDEVTWCWHRIHESDVRYVRADTDMQAEIDRMSDALREIGDFAHDRSTGPAVPDALWEVRSMAYSAESNITSPQHQVKKGESS